MEAITSATRIFVGGLGERVTEDDLRKTFLNLGSLEAVEIIRTKGRSFAYINFLPSSDNSLNKLFSMYNGCSWKGGKLKLEKAKEHYVDRMQREWVEDAEVESSAHIKPTDDDGNMIASVESKSTLDLEKGQIHIFFPKLRQMRSLPLRGSGKHKYSFQRLQVPCLPIHICDCCLENSGPVPTPPQTFHNAVIQDAGINEEEINMMNSVMNRVLNKKTGSAPKHSRPSKEREAVDSQIQDDGVNEEEINLMESVMRKVFHKGSSSKTEQKGLQEYLNQSKPISDFPIDTSDIDDGTDDDSDDDDDDIQLNVVSKGEEYPEQSNQFDTDDDDDDIKINTLAGQNDDSFPENWELQTKLDIETAKSNEDVTFDGLATESKQASQETKAKSSNKRKSLSDEPSEKETELNTVEPGTKKSSKTGMWSQKSPWKQLVEDGGKNSSFSLSHITHEDSKPKNPVGQTTDNETLSNSDEHKSVNIDLHENLDKPSSEPEEQEESPTAQAPTLGPRSGVDKLTRGVSWLQKSSWTTLVSGDSSSSFSISQIVPEKFLEKQETHKPRASGTTVDGSRGPKPLLMAAHKKKDEHARGTEPNKTPNETTEKKSSLERMKASNLVPGIGLGVRISETCPFMRNAESLSGAAKKRNKNNK